MENLEKAKLLPIDYKEFNKVDFQKLYEAGEDVQKAYDDIYKSLNSEAKKEAIKIEKDIYFESKLHTKSNAEKEKKELEAQSKRETDDLLHYWETLGKSEEAWGIRKVELETQYSHLSNREDFEKFLEIEEADFKKRFEKDIEINTAIKPIFEFLSDIGADELAKNYEREFLGFEFEKERDIVLKYNVSQIADFEKDDELLKLLKGDKTVSEIAIELKIDEEKVQQVKDLYDVLESRKDKYITKHVLETNGYNSIMTDFYTTIGDIDSAWKFQKSKIIAEYGNLVTDKQLSEYLEVKEMEFKVANMSDLQKSLASSLSDGLQSALEGEFDFSSFTQELSNSISSMYANQLSNNLMSGTSAFSGMAGGGWGMAGAMTGSYVINNWSDIQEGLFGGKVSSVDKGFELTADLKCYFDTEVENIKSYETFKKSGGLFSHSKTWTELKDYTLEQTRQIKNLTAQFVEMFSYFDLGEFSLDAGKYTNPNEAFSQEFIYRTVFKDYTSDFALGLYSELETFAITIGENLSDNTKEILNDFGDKQEITTFLPSDIGIDFETYISALRGDRDSIVAIREALENTLNVSIYKITATNKITEDFLKAWSEFAGESDVSGVIYEAYSNIKEGENSLEILKNEISGISNLDFNVDIAKENLSLLGSQYENILGKTADESLTKILDAGARGITNASSNYQAEFNSIVNGETIDLGRWEDLKDKILETNDFTPETVEVINNLNSAILDLAKAENERLKALQSQQKSLAETFDTVSGTDYFASLDALSSMDRLGVGSREDFLKVVEGFISSSELLTDQQSRDITTLGGYFGDLEGSVLDLVDGLKDLENSIGDYQTSLATGNLSPLLEADKMVIQKENLNDLYSQFNTALINAKTDGTTSSELEILNNLESKIESSLNDYLSTSRDVLSDTQYSQVFNSAQLTLEDFKTQLSTIDLDVNPVVIATNEVRDEIKLLREEIANIQIKLDINSNIEATYTALQSKGLI